MRWVNIVTQSTTVPDRIGGTFNPAGDPGVMLAAGWRKLMVEPPVPAAGYERLSPPIWLQDPTDPAHATWAASDTLIQTRLDREAAEQAAEADRARLPVAFATGIETPKVVIVDAATGVAHFWANDGGDLIGGIEQHASPTPNEATLAQRLADARQARRELRQAVVAERDALVAIEAATKTVRDAAVALDGVAFAGVQKTLIVAVLKALTDTQRELINTQQECRKLAGSVAKIVRGVP